MSMKRIVFVTGLPNTGKTQTCIDTVQKCRFMGHYYFDQELYACCDASATDRMMLYREKEKLFALTKKMNFSEVLIPRLENYLRRNPFAFHLFDGYNFVDEYFISLYMIWLNNLFGFDDFNIFIPPAPNQLTLSKSHPLYHKQIDASELIPSFSSGGAYYQGYYFVKDAHSNSENKLSQLHLPDLWGKTVLDIGCNAGLFSLEAARNKALSVLGVDSSQEFINAAREVKKFLMPSANILFINAGFDDLSPDTYGTFDVVLCISALHYCQNLTFLLSRIAKMTNELFVLEVPVGPPGKAMYSIDGTQWIYQKDILIEMLNKQFSTVEEVGHTQQPRYPPNWNPEQVALHRSMQRIVFHCKK